MISIIIPVYNAKKTISRCLESIYIQNYPRNLYEVIVIDDASTDNSANIVKTYPFKLIRLNKNIGPAAARNLGAKKSMGRILFFVDSDIILDKNSLIEIKKAFRDKNVKCLTGMYKKYPENKGIFPLYKSFLWYHEISNVKLDYVDTMNTACGAIRKNVFIGLKGFNQKYRGVECEDVEFSRRLAKKYKIFLNKKLKVGHYYPTFFKGLKKSFKTYLQWWPLFLKTKKFESAMTSKKLGVGTAFAGLSFILLGLSYFFGRNIFFILGVISFIIFISSYSSFYYFIFKQNKKILSILAIFISYINSIVICAAIFLSTIKNGFRYIKKNN
nr:hypothetical protein [uncultured archaeon]